MPNTARQEIVQEHVAKQGDLGDYSPREKVWLKLINTPVIREAFIISAVISLVTMTAWEKFQNRRLRL